MSGYLYAHGDTMTVDLVVSNNREPYEAYQSVLNRVEWDGQTWQGIESAAAEYRRLVRGLSHRTYSDLQGIDLDRVDFHGLIKSDLGECNLQAGREFDAGLTYFVREEAR